MQAVIFVRNMTEGGVSTFMTKLFVAIGCLGPNPARDVWSKKDPKPPEEPPAKTLVGDPESYAIADMDPNRDQNCLIWN